jgi:hypothetical protein
MHFEREREKAELEERETICRVGDTLFKVAS